MTISLNRPPVIASTLSEATAVRERHSPDRAAIPDPDPQWAAQNPNKFLAFLMVSPRPCAALDALFDQ